MRVVLIATIAAAIIGGPILAIASTSIIHASFVSAAFGVVLLAA